jgi:NTE family protein
LFVPFYDSFQSDEQAELALRHPTDLKAPSKAQYDMLARHGFEIADATLTTYVIVVVGRPNRRLPD